jgi:hypothetical protein
MRTSSCPSSKACLPDCRRATIYASTVAAVPAFEPSQLCYPGNRFLPIRAGVAATTNAIERASLHLGVRSRRDDESMPMKSGRRKADRPTGRPPVQCRRGSDVGHPWNLRCCGERGARNDRPSTDLGAVGAEESSARSGSDRRWSPLVEPMA